MPLPTPRSSFRQLIPVAAFCLATAAAPPGARARNMMSADGPGGTYELLRQAYTTELPDCGHMVPHITEEFDNELNKNVFIFHAHVNQDDDRCGGTDRQRTEIRAKSPDIQANNGETVYYRWKFKLATGFQGSTRFTHIFQIKSDLGAPIMTLTPRVSTFGITGRAAGSSSNVELAKLVGAWVVVDLKVLYSDNGRIELNIRRVSDGQVVYSYSGGADMWDANASAHDSKFGIYRSLLSKESLRDEQVRFADFCASKVSAQECADGATPPPSDAGSAPPASDAGAPADTGSGATGGAGTGGTTGSGGASGGTGGSSGAAGGTGGSTPAPPRDASTGGQRQDASGSAEEDPPAETETPPRSAAGGCSVGSARGPAGGAAALSLILTALALMRRRSR
jgi:hypothetical protein